MTQTAPTFVEPSYGDRSLADVLPAVSRALGLSADVLGPASSSLVFPDAPAYVVYLVDGMGADLLERYAYAAPYLSSLLGPNARGTAGVPSTTATSLTSLGTALAPGAHGLVGYTARVPGTDELLNHLQWDSDVDPTQWQPHPTAYDRLRAAGVSVSTVSKSRFSGSGLTRASQRGAVHLGADGSQARLAGALKASSSSPSVTYVYDSDLDYAGHKYGVASRQWMGQLSEIDEEIERLREELPSAVRLVVVADHGMVDCPRESRVDVDSVAGMRDGITMIGGEARFRHLYVADGALDDVVASWRSVLGTRAEVLTRDEVIARGWFGPVDDLVVPRLGDVMVACRDDFGVFASRDFAYETSLIGLHGSLSSAEMTIPVLVD